MSPNLVHLYLIYILLWALPAVVHAGEISILRENGKLVIKAGEDLFTQYIYKDEKRSKPVLYPVIGPQQKAMTRNFPFEEKGEGEENGVGRARVRVRVRQCFAL